MADTYDYSYSTSGYLVGVSKNGAALSSYSYDLNGNRLNYTGPLGAITATYDAQDRLLAYGANSYSYTADGLMASMTDPNNGVYTFTHDAMGKLVKDQNPAGGSWTLAKAGTVTNYTVTMTSAEGRAKSYSVAAQPNGSVVSTNTSPSGSASVSVTNLDGTTVSTSADGTVTTVAKSPDPRFGMMNPLKQNKTVKTPSGLTSTSAITKTVVLSNPLDKLSLTAQTDTMSFNGKTFTIARNIASSTTTLTTPAGRQTITTLDAKGRLVSQATTGFATSSNSYDSLGRLATITKGLGVDSRVTTRGYDTSGRLISVTNPLGQSINYAYNAIGKVAGVTYADGRSVSSSYDAIGRLTSITAPGGQTHMLTYDAAGRRTGYIPPLVGAIPQATAYAYNLDAQLTRISRPDGKTLDMTYDNGGRLQNITAPDASVNYTYTAPGQACCGSPSKASSVTRTAIGGATQTVSAAYDGFLFTGETFSGAVTGSVQLAFNNDFRVASISGGGAAISYAYDNDGLVTQAGSLTLSRNAATGQVKTSSLGSITTASAYNLFGERIGDSASFGTSKLFDTQFTTDKLGRVTRKIETVQGVAATNDYSYSTSGYLVGVSKNGAALSSYSYDLNGNRLNYTGPLGAITATYDAQDRLLAYGANTYAYTSNGELLTKTTNGLTTTYAYDVTGNLVAATLPDGTLVEYVIDGRNRRVGKKVNGILTQAFLYYESRLVAELDGAGNTVSVFAYATSKGAPDYMVKGGVTYRIVNDHLGGPRLVLDSSTGAVVQRIDYDEYGNILTDTNPGFQPFGFAGGLYDTATKLTRFGSRDYDAEVGRWTAKDPALMGGGLNLYAYVMNDPVNQVDRDGLFSESTISSGPGNGIIIPKKPADVGDIPCITRPCPGYKYCGSGNYGMKINPPDDLDKACKFHDGCYKKAGLSADDVSVFNPGQGNCKTPGANCDKKQCDQDECDDALCEEANKYTSGHFLTLGIKLLFCDPQ